MGFEEPHLRLIFYLVDPRFLRISHISAYAAYQGGLVLLYGLGRRVIASKWALGPFLYCLDDVSYSG